MADEAVTCDAVSARRRRLIKASAAAVPVVMTLRSGAAAAMASTYHCSARDKQHALQDGVENVLEGLDNMLIHDNWVRVPGRKVSITHQGVNYVYYCVDTGDGPNGLGGWQCFNEEDGLEYDGTPPNLNQNEIRQGRTVALLAYLQFNEYGDDTGGEILYYPRILKVADAEMGYAPLTGSCLSSIHPNLNIQV